MIDKNVFTTIIDDSETGVKDLLTDIGSLKFNELIGEQLYINAFYDGTKIVANLLNNPNNVTTATISLLGNIYSVNVVDNQINFPIVIHPSVADMRLNATVKAEGFHFSTLEIGGSSGIEECQVYFDGNGVYNVVPTKNYTLAQYHQNKEIDMSWSTVDLATIDGLLVHTLFNYVLPNITLTLTEEEQNGLNEIKNNLLPLIPTTLSNVATDGTKLDLHYASYRYHMQQGKTAMDKYVADMQEITKHVTLK